MVSSKKLVAARATKSSAETFGPPPVVAGEDPSRYDELSARVFAAVRPKDVIEEMIVRDVVDHEWQILCLRRMKSGLFAAGLQTSLVAILLAAPPMTESKARDLARRFVAGDPSAAKEVDKTLASVGLSIDAAMANTMTVRLHDFEAIERLMASAEARRHAAMRELERRRSALADARRREEEEVVDADFEDVDPDEGDEPHHADDRGDDRADDDEDQQFDDDYAVHGR
jgi:hypothetical protein